MDWQASLEGECDQQAQLERVLTEDSIAEHGNGTVKAVKLVYKVEETDEGKLEQGTAVQGRELGSNW